MVCHPMEMHQGWWHTLANKQVISKRREDLSWVDLYYGIRVQSKCATPTLQVIPYIPLRKIVLSKLNIILFLLKINAIQVADYCNILHPFSGLSLFPALSVIMDSQLPTDLAVYTETDHDTPPNSTHTVAETKVCLLSSTNKLWVSDHRTHYINIIPL